VLNVDDLVAHVQHGGLVGVAGRENGLYLVGSGRHGWRAYWRSIAKSSVAIIVIELDSVTQRESA
jgi:hypothetical protein